MRLANILLSGALFCALATPSTAQSGEWLDRDTLVKYAREDLPAQKYGYEEYGKPCSVYEDRLGYTLVYSERRGENIHRNEKNAKFKPDRSRKYLFISDVGLWRDSIKEYNVRKGFNEAMADQYGLETPDNFVICLYDKQGLKRFREELITWWKTHDDYAVMGATEKKRAVLDVDLPWPRAATLD